MLASFSVLCSMYRYTTNLLAAHAWHSNTYALALIMVRFVMISQCGTILMLHDMPYDHDSVFEITSVVTITGITQLLHASTCITGTNSGWGCAQ